MLTKREIEILGRANAATEGPWVLDDDDGSIETADGGYLARVAKGGTESVAYVAQHANIRTVMRTGEEFSHADGRFIAHARSDVPYLLGEVDRLRGQLVAIAKASPEIAEGIMALLVPFEEPPK